MEASLFEWAARLFLLGALLYGAYYAGREDGRRK